MTREEAIYELGEWLEQMIQHGVPSHSAKRKALATAIALLSAESEQTVYCMDCAKSAPLITCNRVKECNGVCPFEDALKHADKMQTMNEQHTVDHDRDWVIGCIEHDGFIKTDRFDKANQIILDALQTEVVRCKDCRHRDLFSCPLADNDFQKDDDYCSWGELAEQTDKVKCPKPINEECVGCVHRDEIGRCLNFMLAKSDRSCFRDSWNDDTEQTDKGGGADG